MLYFFRDENVNVKFQLIPGEIIEMEHICGKNNFTWRPEEKIGMFEDGTLFTQIDRLVEIHDKGFCLDTIVSGQFNNISAIKCQHVNSTKSCTNRNDMVIPNLPTYSSCSRHDLDSKFRTLYSVLGGFSLVKYPLLI